MQFCRVLFCVCVVAILLREQRNGHFLCIGSSEVLWGTKGNEGCREIRGVRIATEFLFTDIQKNILFYIRKHEKSYLCHSVYF